MNNQNSPWIEVLSEFFRSSEFAGFSSSLFGAFFGALCAYLFATRSEQAKLKEQHYDATIRLQLALMFFLNFLENVRVQHLNEFRDDPARAFKIKQFFHAPASFHIDFDSISFLLVGEHANLIQDIHLAERTYFNVIHSIDTRNTRLDRFYSDPRTKIHKFDINTGAASVEADARDIKMMTDLTDALYDTVDSAITKIEGILPRLRAALKGRFPNRVFLNYEKSG